MNRYMKIITISLTGFISFFLFLFLLFPFGLLNQTLSSTVSRQTGFLLDIDEINFSLPLGLKASKISLSSKEGDQVNFSELSFGLKLLPLFLGDLKVFLELSDHGKGRLKSEVSFSVFTLLSGKAVLPQSLVLKTEKFSLDQALDFSLKTLANSKMMNVMVKPILKSILVQGNLNTDISLVLDSSDLNNSQGITQINLRDFKIKSLDDPPIFPEQLFKKTNLSASLKDGVLVVDKSSEISSDDLSLKIRGKITQKTQIMKSIVDLSVNFELRSVLSEQYGFLIEAFTKKEGSSQVDLKIEGPLSPQPDIKVL